MLRVLDKLFEFCASLKLAIVLILGLAFYLGAATFYEARYGALAARAVIYSSSGFVMLMAALSINVMAAVVYRYPWKRRQTGFIITHFGIEVLLLGCLIGCRAGVDGHVIFALDSSGAAAATAAHANAGPVVLSPPADEINLLSEQLGVTV